MTSEARGTFEVTITPQAPDEAAGGSPVGRMSLDKRFHGDLDATSTGHMLAVRTDIDSSAGYVVMERVSGSLQGRRGSFALQHSGTMTRGTPSLTVSVVPDSGTDELVGLTGTMAIDRVEGQHLYTITYTLPESR